LLQVCASHRRPAFVVSFDHERFTSPGASLPSATSVWRPVRRRLLWVSITSRIPRLSALTSTPASAS
jgi:hypothetical protein